jgi:hypothetical protein
LAAQKLDGFNRFASTEGYPALSSQLTESVRETIIQWIERGLEEQLQGPLPEQEYRLTQFIRGVDVQHVPMTVVTRLLGIADSQESDAEAFLEWFQNRTPAAANPQVFGARDALLGLAVKKPEILEALNERAGSWWRRIVTAGWSPSYDERYREWNWRRERIPVGAEAPASLPTSSAPQPLSPALPSSEDVSLLDPVSLSEREARHYLGQNRSQARPRVDANPSALVERGEVFDNSERLLDLAPLPDGDADRYLWRNRSRTSSHTEPRRISALSHEREASGQEDLILIEPYPVPQNVSLSIDLQSFDACDKEIGGKFYMRAGMDGKKRKLLPDHEEASIYLASDSREPTGPDVFLLYKYGYYLVGNKRGLVQFRRGRGSLRELKIGDYIEDGDQLIIGGKTVSIVKMARPLELD